MKKRMTRSRNVCWSQRKTSNAFIRWTIEMVMKSLSTRIRSLWGSANHDHGMETRSCEDDFQNFPVWGVWGKLGISPQPLLSTLYWNDTYWRARPLSTVGNVIFVSYSIFMCKTLSINTKYGLLRWHWQERLTHLHIQVAASRGSVRSSRSLEI